MSDTEEMANEADNPSPAIDKIQITRTYEKEKTRYLALLDEVVFILKDSISTSSIKLHNIEHRVKSISSILDKCERQKSNTPFIDFHDIVGARVICLFKEDIDQIGKLIGKAFDVEKIDDKRNTDNAPLGYLSVHYVCKMPKAYKGPRYDGAAGLQFEIQVRTLCMHCWAAVSHYLEYKGDWDVPKEFKMALSALSGLFYVADNEFQQFYQMRSESIARLEQATAKDLTTSEDLNLDTLTAYLAQKFPGRNPSKTDRVSNFVSDLKACGFKTISDLDHELDRANKAVILFEKEKFPQTSKPLGQLGMARVSLGFVSPEFRNRAGSNLIQTDDPKYHNLIAG